MMHFMKTSLFISLLLASAVTLNISAEPLSSHVATSSSSDEPLGVSAATLNVSAESTSEQTLTTAVSSFEQSSNTTVSTSGQPMENRIAAVSKQKMAALADTTGFRKFRFGGYGEILGQFKDYGINRFNGTSQGNDRRHRASVSIPRFVLAFDYKFNPKWILGAEIEFEAGGVGTAVELENTENGEYETEIEKGGEVALEQLHITRLIIPEFNVRVGHLILPVGLTNAHHEPINFFGAARPESETTLMPSTWHETGIQFFGSAGRGYARFDYLFMIVAGLNANGFDRDNWVQGGKPGIFENDNFTSPAYVARVDYTGVPGLRTGLSFYYCNNTAANADKSHTYASVGKVPVAITTFDAQYRNQYVTARGNITYGYLGNSAALSSVNRTLSNKSPYSRLVPIAKNTIGYGVEAGFNLTRLCGLKNNAVYPYARYEYYNPQYRGSKSQTMDKRLEVSQWQVGANWFALPNLVVKADYTMRQIGTQKVFGKGLYTSENEFSIGVAYIGWFLSK